MSDTPSFEYDVFLSHNSADKDKVRRLAERLRDAGLQVWFDDWIIKPGDEIFTAIERGLEGSRVQVLCLSPAALKSDWVTMERNTVLFRDPTNAGRRFIPLLLADCDLPDTLRRFKYVDFRDQADAAFDELLTACRPDGDSTPPVAEPEATKKRAKKPKKKSAKKRAKPPKQPDQAEPLVTFERKMMGHTDWVRDVAVSPDGTWVASVSDDWTVRIWDLEMGECRQRLEGHAAYVYSVAITPDGGRVLSASGDHSVRVWDASQCLEWARLDGHTDRAWSVVALHDNVHALSAGVDNTLRLWDLTSGSCIKTIRCGDRLDDIYCSVVNSAGTQALSGHRDAIARLWDLETGVCLATLRGHSGYVVSIQITPDGRSAVSGSEDGTVKVWDLETGTCVGTLEGHTDTVHSVAISRDGALIASTGFTDGTVRLWDRESGACLQVITGDSPVNPISVAFSPDDSRLVVGTTTGEICVYRLAGIPSAPSPETARRYVNAKVVLIGEGTVGKTSLAHRLIEDEYVIRDRTHGMNVWPLALPLSTDDAMEREALLWDLAGQEDYRLIHQLFLGETALAMLLVNPQKDDLFAEAGDWLTSLKAASNGPGGQRDVARLLIFSQIDVGGMKVSNAKIDRFRDEHGFAGWLSTSAKTGQNCSDGGNSGEPSALKQLIADNIPWDKLPWTSTPRLLAELKNAVVTMRDEADIRVLRFAELAQRLEQVLPRETFDDADVRTAVTLLANHGLVLPLKFGDLVLLRPELVNGYSGAIIRAARAHTDEIGCVPEADVYDSDFDFTGVERLEHRPDEELLLRAIVQTLLDNSLCIAEDTPEGRHLVFPSQYRREKDIPHAPIIFVSYTFNGEWQSVWTTLVVRLWYSHEFEHPELWRNAAEFATNKGHTLGLKIDNRQGEGEATISVYFDLKVPDELKVILIEYVHQHLGRYASDVVRDRRYVCQACGKPVTDLAVVQERLEAGKDFIICQTCDVKVVLTDFIEQRLKSDPVARRILVMEETATRGLDTQSLEQILIGHMMAISGEANQIFRPVTMFDHGIDGEVEFKDGDGGASGKKIYVQLKSGDSHLRLRKRDGQEVFDVKDPRHLKYWVDQPVDVYLVIRQSDERSSTQSIRWMNLTQYLKNRPDKKSRQIIFDGEDLDAPAIWRARDSFFPPKAAR